MFFRHSTDKLIYPITAFVVVAMVSYRPVYRLRPDMPKGFFAADAPCGPHRPLEQKIACAYWDSAQMNVQWKYARALPLPEEVPPEFAIDAPALGPAASSPVTREFFWHRLQSVWYLRETWKAQYEWNWGWASDPLASANQWFKDTTNRWFTIK